jgi:hypothetical protein
MQNHAGENGEFALIESSEIAGKGRRFFKQ